MAEKQVCECVCCPLLLQGGFLNCCVSSLRQRGRRVFLQAPLPSQATWGRDFLAAVAEQTGLLQPGHAPFDASGVGSRLWVSCLLIGLIPENGTGAGLNRFCRSFVHVAVTSLALPVLCQQSGLLVSQPASDEISLIYLNHVFKLLTW